MYEYCGVGSGKSTSGTYNVALNISSEPFTIAGSLTGKGSVAISGDYKFCDNLTIWSGTSDLTAGVKLATGVSARIPEVLILKVEVAGSTTITEKLVADSTELKITTNWDGLTATGRIIVILPKLFGGNVPISYNPSKTFFEADNLASKAIALPSLK